MTAPAPTLPAGRIDHPQSEEEVITGKRKPKDKEPKMLNDEDLLLLLRSYYDEGKEARDGGVDSRTANWDANWDAYWGRYDTSGKAEWQAAEQMSEFAKFIDRYVNVLRLALVSQPDWMDVIDPTDKDGQRNRIMREFVKIHLDHCTTNRSGQRIGFDATFGSAVKSGALTMLAASVTFDRRTGFVNVDPVNAFELIFDPTGRGLYRIRRTPIDYWQLEKMKDEKDSAGKPYYNNAAIERLQAHEDGEAKAERERISGGTETSGGGSIKKPIEIDEYLCVIINSDGHLVKENQLVVVANQREIIRGPEDNPNWHGKDWIVAVPSVDVPFSVYGRSYGETFRALVATFIETTNLILDGMFADSVAAHMVHYGALADPSEVAGGLYPGIAVTADEDWPPGKDFVSKIEMGGVSPDGFRVWEAIKSEMRESAGANELSMGQVPPKGDITAREIEGAERGNTVSDTGGARDIDTRFLAPIVELVLMTALQHFDPDKNPVLAAELGPAWSKTISENRENFAKKKYRYVAKGLTAAMDRGRRLKQKLGFLQVLGQSEVLAAAYAKEHSLMKLLRELMIDFDIDAETLKKDEKELRADKEAEVTRKTAEATAGAPGGASAATGAGARGGAPLPAGLPR